METWTFAIFQQDQAISTFNFLNNEDRYVGIVAIPPETTEMFEEERGLIRMRQERRELLEFDESVSSKEFGVDDLPPVTGNLNPDRGAHRLPLSDEDWTYNKWGPPRKWLRVNAALYKKNLRLMTNDVFFWSLPCTMYLRPL